METFEQFLQKHRKPILITISVVLIGIIGYNIAIFISRIGKIPVTIAFAPFDSTVQINDEDYQNNKVHYLSPGDYTIKASREHFESLTVEYTLEKNSQGTNFVGGLVPSDEEGIRIVDIHNNDFLKVESLGSIDAANEANKLIEESPITQYLPVNFSAYSVSYNYNDQGEFFVELVLKKGINFAPQAVATLYDLDDNINPASYKIIVRDYKDPFGDFTKNSEKDIAKFFETGYGENFSNYQILSNRIIRQDDYYGILIVPRDVNLAGESAYPIYRAIIKQVEGNWELLSAPYPVVSQYNAAEAPLDFLNQLNRTFTESDI